MKAARFHAPNAPLVVEDVPDPAPGPVDVVVEIATCGICASDLHFVHGQMPLPVPPPVIMGHEASGTIVGLGSAVRGWAEGDRVAINAGKGCGTCERCAAGAVEECRQPQVMGVHYDGGFAQYMATPASTLARIPDAVSFEHAAITSDSVATPYAALVERAALRPGERVGIWGVGGVGTHGVQIARVAGASLVVAVDPLPQARERALAVGADLALDPADDVASAIREATGGWGLDVAADMVGHPGAIKQGMRSLERGGRMLAVGQSMERLDAGPILAVSFLGLSILGHLGYRPRHLEEVMALIGSGRLHLSGSITDRMPLGRVNEGIDRLTRKDESIVRLMVEPASQDPG